MSQKFQLKNGLNVILIESHKSPVISVQMWVKTGSADETKGVEGISHFIEHLVFKGTEEYKVGEIAYAVEAAGGELNAYTSFDQTVFYVTLSKDYSETGLSVISQMMGCPTFDEAEIDREREVVIEEIKRSIDNPHQRASRLLFANAFKKHPYGIPVIGYAENIKRVTRREIVKYYNSRYVPQNMNLVIVGDFSSKEMKKKVDFYFSKFRKFKLKSIRRKVESKAKTLKIAVQSTEFIESLLYLSWPIPNVKHKDQIALTLMSIILGQGESSRLFKEARNRLKIVNHIGASAFAPKDPGLVAVSAGLNSENLSELMNCIQSEVISLISKGCRQDELDKAKNIVESEKLYSLETVDGQAGLYGHFELLYRDYKYFNQSLKDMRNITTDDIRSVARKYLNPNSMAISYLTNNSSDKCEEFFRRWHKELAFAYKLALKEKHEFKKNKANKAKLKKWVTTKGEVSLPAKMTVLPSGARIITKKISGSPVISARAGFLGGLRSETTRTRGCTELLSRTWTAGTKNITEDELNQKIENMASGISAFGGRNTMGVSMVSLVPYFSETVELFEDVLLSPALPEEAIAREKNQMQEVIRARNDKPSQICMLNFAEKMFAGHPYGLDLYPASQDLERLEQSNLIGHMATTISAENLVISIAGDFDEKLFIKKAQDISQKLHKKSELPKVIAAPALQKNEHVFIKQQKEQTHLVLGYRGLSFQDKNRYALEIMQSILSGQGGRLFIELRDKASLAYTVSPIRMDGIETGYFGAYIGCSPEKAIKALRMMKEEFLKLTDKLVPEDELQRAKRYLSGRHDISLQKTRAVSDHYYFDTTYGLDFNEVESYNNRISEVTAHDIKKLATQIFSGYEVVSVVGKTDVGVSN